MYLCLDVLRNISLNWMEIVKEITININENYEKIEIKGEQIEWKLAEQYPSCQSIDLFELFKLKKSTIRKVQFRFRIVENMGVTILTEDRKRASFRAIRDNLMIYSGPSMISKDLKKPHYKRSIFSISQILYSEFDKNKNCTNYPNEYFSSFKLTFAFDAQQIQILQWIYKIFVLGNWRRWL